MTIAIITCIPGVVGATFVMEVPQPLPAELTVIGSKGDLPWIPLPCLFLAEMEVSRL